MADLFGTPPDMAWTTMRATPVTLDTLGDLFAGVRWPVGDERRLHDAIAFVLHGARIPYVREYVLDARNRIDFYLPEDQIGIEVKIQGGPSTVLRQVARYAAFPAIAGLVLLTTRARAASLIPETLHGTPIRVITGWEGQL